jgi:hypothetical protein
MGEDGNGLRRRWWLAPLLGFAAAVWVCLDCVAVGEAEIETVGRVLLVLGIALVAALFTGLRPAQKSLAGHSGRRSRRTPDRASGIAAESPQAARRDWSEEPGPGEVEGRPPQSRKTRATQGRRTSTRSSATSRVRRR